MGIIKREETIVFKHIFILFFNIFFQDISRFITAIAQKQGHTSAAGATVKFENTNPFPFKSTGLTTMDTKVSGFSEEMLADVRTKTFHAKGQVSR